MIHEWNYPEEVEEVKPVEETTYEFQLNESKIFSGIPFN
jgi:hypothetical protein